MVVSLYVTIEKASISMGYNRSFRIAKRFDIGLEDGQSVQVRIRESEKRHVCSVCIGKDAARWLIKCVEENIIREGESSFIRTFRENELGFVIRRSGNDFGRFVELMVYGSGGLKGHLVIPKGQKQNGWRGFTAELRYVLEPQKEASTVNDMTSNSIPRHGFTDGEKQHNKQVVVGGDMTSMPCRNHDKGGRHTWSSRFFPHMENSEKLKRQEHTLRDFCREAGKEKLEGFGANFSEVINAKNEVMSNLKVKLTCDTDGNWKASWVGLVDANLCALSGPLLGPPPSPQRQTHKIWKPIGPKPSKPVSPIRHTHQTIGLGSETS